MLFIDNEEEQRFAHALLASILVHVLVLGYVKGVEPLRKSGAGGALLVSFRASPAISGTQNPEPPPVRSQAEVSPATLRPAPATQVRPAVKSVQPAPARVAPQQVSTQPVPSSNATGPVRTSVRRGPGVVDVTLLIGPDGHPQTLVWDQLPALTRAQFEQLEAMIKQQTYASTSGARLTQEVDVFGLLGIGRRASSAAPVVQDGVPPMPQ